MKNFAVIGVGGYIAPRHLKAIHDTGNKLVVATDTNDSVGQMDRYCIDAKFYTSFEKFESYVESLIGTPDQIDYVSVCSPNHLHAAHIRFALRIGAECICEKPITLTVSEIDDLKAVQNRFGHKIYTILQLRFHPKLLELKKSIEQSKKNKKPGEKDEVELTYMTSRGPWYHVSWKGDSKKSGGIATNIGVHFFDLLSWLYGSTVKSELHFSNENTQSGYLEFEHARVKWFLSINPNYLPESCRKENKTTFRMISINGQEVEFSEGFTDLHTEIYKKVLTGEGYGLDESRPAIAIVENIRSLPVIGRTNQSHPSFLSL